MCPTQMMVTLPVLLLLLLLQVIGGSSGANNRLKWMVSWVGTFCVVAKDGKNNNNNNNNAFELKFHQILQQKVYFETFQEPKL